MSFVNKSGKRFVPKVGGRRSGRALSLAGVKRSGENAGFDRENKEEEQSNNLDELKNNQKPFAQPQRRLNSLTTPTQLLDSVNTGNLTITPRSRRGSSVLNNTNTNSISNRRPSIVKTSRRGSSVVVEDVSVGGVITGSNNVKESSIPIGIKMGEPIRIPMNRRKSSVSSIPIKRRRSSARLNTDVSQAVKQRVKEAVKNVEMMKKKQLEEEALEKNPAIITTPNFPHAKVSVKKVEPDVVVISKVEQEANFKWMMSKTQKKLIKVEVSKLNLKKEEKAEEDVGPTDVVKEEEEEVVISALPIKKDYNLSFKIHDVKQLRDLRVVDDAHLTQHIKIDEDKMTMGDLCKPFFPIGEVSKNYERAVEGERKRKERQKKDSYERRMARKYRLNEKEMNKLHDSKHESDGGDQKAKLRELMEKDLTDSQNKKRNVPLLQIHNGQVVYSQESTLVNRHGEETNSGLERVEENPYENIVTSNSYSKKKQTLRWTPQETAELFKAVSLWGTDFSLISQLFPYRTRKQIKAKFVLEEKKHPHLVEFALLRKLPVDIDEYSGKSGRQFKTLDEYNDELQSVKQKHDEELKSMAAAKELAIAEDRESQQHNSMNTFKPRSRKAVIAEFRRNEEIVGSLD